MREEDADGQQSAQTAAPFRIKPHQRVQTQPGAGNVADVEHQPAEYHQHREQVTTAWNRFVGHICGTHSGQGDDTPDVKLNHEVDQNRRQDTERKCRTHLGRERGGLGDESRSDGRSRHHENCGDQGRASRLCKILSGLCHGCLCHGIIPTVGDGLIEQ